MSSVNPFNSGVQKAWTNPSYVKKTKKTQESQPIPCRIEGVENTFDSQKGRKRKFNEVHERPLSQECSEVTEMKVHKRAARIAYEEKETASTPTETTEPQSLSSSLDYEEGLYEQDESQPDEEFQLLFGQDESLTDEEYKLLYSQEHHLLGSDDKLPNDHILARRAIKDKQSHDIWQSVSEFSIQEAKWHPREDEIITSLLKEGSSLEKIANSKAIIGKEPKDVYMRAAQMWILYISKSFETSQENWTSTEDKKLTFLLMKGYEPSAIAAEVTFYKLNSVIVCKRASEILTKIIYLSINTPSLLWNIKADRAVEFLLNEGWDVNKIVNSGHFPLKSIPGLNTVELLPNLRELAVDSLLAAHESKWTAEEDEKIISLLKEGYSKVRIANEFSMPQKTSSEIFLRAAQMWILYIQKSFLSSKENWTYEEDKKITFLLMNGYEPRAIASEASFSGRVSTEIFARATEIRELNVFITHSKLFSTWSATEIRLLDFLLREAWSVNKIFDSGHFPLKSRRNIADKVFGLQSKIHQLNRINSMYARQELKWSPGEDYKILSLLQEGNSKVKISQIYTPKGKSPNEIFMRATQMWILYISKNFVSNRENWTSEEDKRITFLVMNGYKPSEIANEFSFDRRDSTMVYRRAAEIHAQKIYFSLGTFSTLWSNEEVRTIHFLLNNGWEPRKIAYSGHFPDKAASLIELKASILRDELLFIENVLKNTENDY